MTQPAAAQDAPTPQQLMQMIEAQQKQLDALKAALKDSQAKADQAAAQAAEAAEKSESFAGLPGNVTVGGVVEVEATDTKAFDGGNSSDIALATLELFVDAKPSDWVETHVQFIFEDNGSNIEFDEAWATIGNLEEFPAYVQFGRYPVPLGSYDTNMSTDTLVETLGSTKESVVSVGFDHSGFSGQAYVYNGDTQEAQDNNAIDQYGLNLTYGAEVQGVEFSLGGSYINNIADSDTITDGLTNSTALTGYVGGYALYGSAAYGPFGLFAGYLSATKAFNSGNLAFNGSGAKPAAWNVEANYTAEVLGKETTFAATVQGTREALALSQPELRIGGAVTVNVVDNAAVTLEYLHDEDYSTGEGGTGESGHTATLKLAAEF